jgi:hypothetical protein
VASAAEGPGIWLKAREGHSPKRACR